jgi:ABC-type branched-subunit amino acid transport system substrate-binding protein
MGLMMQTGVEIAFYEANSQGGVHGRNLCLITLDDGYEPERTVPNIRQLIQQEKVLALIGNVGTPTAVVAAPICRQMQTLFLRGLYRSGIPSKNTA